MTREISDATREKLRVAGEKGGRTTLERHGRWRMSVIGKTGYAVAVERHGVGYVSGILDAKHHRRRKPVNVGADLAVARILADF